MAILGSAAAVRGREALARPSSSNYAKEEHVSDRVSQFLPKDIFERPTPPTPFIELFGCNLDKLTLSLLARVILLLSAETNAVEKRHLAINFRSSAAMTPTSATKTRDTASLSSC